MVGEMLGGVVGWDWIMDFSIAIYHFTPSNALPARQSYHLHLVCNQFASRSDTAVMSPPELGSAIVRF